jgi:hypothetical protein
MEYVSLTYTNQHLTMRSNAIGRRSWQTDMAKLRMAGLVIGSTKTGNLNEVAEGDFAVSINSQQLLLLNHEP